MIDSGQILLKNKIKKQKVKQQNKQQHPTPYKLNSSTRILKQHSVLAPAKSKSKPGLNQTKNKYQSLFRISLFTAHVVPDIL